jgi:uncharacterized membrane protein
MSSRWLWLAVVLTAAAAAGSLVVWANRAEWLPERVPTHWGADGEADAWTAREDMLPALMVMPALLLGVIGLSYLLPWLSPQKFKVEPFRPTYEYVMFLIVVIFAYLHGVILASYAGLVEDVGRWIIGGSLLVLAAMGNVLGKVQRNFWIGVRTPWTLASDAVWDGTHRLAAWLFVLAGVGGFVLMMLGVSFWFCFGVAIALILVPIPYSLYLYKRLEREGKLHLEPVGAPAGNEEANA